MKVILAGSTGFIGREVLEQCIQHPSVTSIVALSRRPLPEPAASHPKVEVVVEEDFTSYSPSTLQAIQGAGACIWTLGRAWIADNDVTKTICLDYTMAAARVLSHQRKVAADNSTNFRFVYLSGGAVERDQDKPLWFMQDYRRIRGQTETELLAHHKDNPDCFEAYIFKPGMVLAKQVNLRDFFRGLVPSVRVDVLSKIMVNVALDGFEEDTLDNTTINIQAKGARSTMTS